MNTFERRLQQVKGDLCVVIPNESCFIFLFIHSIMVSSANITDEQKIRAFRIFASQFVSEEFLLHTRSCIAVLLYRGVSIETTMLTSLIVMRSVVGHSKRFGSTST